MHAQTSKTVCIFRFYFWCVVFGLCSCWYFLLLVSLLLLELQNLRTIDIRKIERVCVRKKKKAKKDIVEVTPKRNPTANNIHARHKYMHCPYSEYTSHTNIQNKVEIITVIMRSEEMYYVFKISIRLYYSRTTISFLLLFLHVVMLFLRWCFGCFLEMDSMNRGALSPKNFTTNGRQMYTYPGENKPGWSIFLANPKNVNVLVLMCFASLLEADLNRAFWILAWNFRRNKSEWILKNFTVPRVYPERAILKTLQKFSHVCFQVILIDL